MTIQEKVQALLVADAGVLALVSRDSFGNPNVLLPGDHQGKSRPYCFHFQVTHRPVYTHASALPATMKRWPHYQVTCVGDTYSTARALASAVIAAVAGLHSGVQYFLRDMKDMPFDLKNSVQEIVLEFEVWGAADA